MRFYAAVMPGAILLQSAIRGQITSSLVASVAQKQPLSEGICVRNESMRRCTVARHDL